MTRVTVLLSTSYLLGHQSGISKAKTGWVTRSGMSWEKTSPMTIPVTMEAAPNIPATEAYSGSTDLEDNTD